MIEFPFLQNVGLMVTYRCQVACPHCIVEAGPHRREGLSLADANDWIHQIATYRQGHVRLLSLTGGEPFFDLCNLKTIASIGDHYGLIVTAVTNAHWASDRKKALCTLRSVPEVKMLGISADVYHQSAIPFESVTNAIIAAKECNVPYTVSVCTESKTDPGYIQLMSRLQEVTDQDTIRTTITVPMGRAGKTIGLDRFTFSGTPSASACWVSGTPVIFPDGRIIACIGPAITLASPHPLYLGNLRQNSLQEIFDRAELNPLLHALRIWGPRKFISVLRKAGFDHLLPSRYIHQSVCDACYQLISNREIVDCLIRLAEQKEFQEEVAYARAYHLQELEMLEILRPDGWESGVVLPATASGTTDHRGASRLSATNQRLT